MAFLKVNILGGTSDEVKIKIDGLVFFHLKDGAILEVRSGTHCFQLYSDGLEFSLMETLDQNDLISFGVIAGGDQCIIGSPNHNIRALSPEEISQLKKEIAEKKQKSRRKKWTIATAICVFFTIFSISAATQGNPRALVALLLTLPIAALGVYKIIKNK